MITKRSREQTDEKQRKTSKNTESEKVTKVQKKRFGGLRLQLELIKVQVAFFMQFAQKGGKGYEYDII